MLRLSRESGAASPPSVILRVTLPRPFTSSADSLLPGATEELPPGAAPGVSMLQPVPASRMAAAAARARAGRLLRGWNRDIRGLSFNVIGEGGDGSRDREKYIAVHLLPAREARPGSPLC